MSSKVEEFMEKHQKHLESIRNELGTSAENPNPTLDQGLALITFIELAQAIAEDMEQAKKYQESLWVSQKKVNNAFYKLHEGTRE